MRWVIASSLAIILMGSTFPALTEAQVPVTDSSAMPEEIFFRTVPSIRVEDWVEGLEIIWDLLFLRDGRLLIAERVGRVRLVSPDGDLRRDPWAEPDSVFHSEVDPVFGLVSGVLGLASHPNFPEEPWVYVMYTLRTNSGPRSRVVRYLDDGERGASMEVVLDDLPVGPSNNGGRIRFGPDGMLYVAVGDAARAEQAQVLSDLRGKLLRVTPEGAVPDDNPWPGSPVWALGLRNPNGIAFHPETGSLFVADNGQQGGDRLFLVKRGLNYGWGRAGQDSASGDYEQPLLEWRLSTPPGSLAFYTSELMPRFTNDLFMTTLLSEALIRIRFEDSTRPHQPTSLERWFVAEDLGNTAPGEGDSEFGRLRAIAVGPDGALYIGTSNRDQAYGKVRYGDDRVIRITSEDSIR